jgi:tetratricopeptide (TPR) repeat protein
MSHQASEYHQKGRGHASRREYSEAIIAYTRAIELNPDEAEFYSDRAVAFFHTDQGQYSLADMNRAQELEPGKSYRYASRAFIKDHLGDLDGAIEDYKVAISIDPDDAIAHNNLGLLEEKKGYKQESKKRFVTADQLADGEKDQIKRGETPDRWKEKNEVDEGSGAESKGFNPDKQRIPVQDASDKESEAPGWKELFREMGKVFSSWDEFKGMLSFIRRGWRKKGE